LIHLHALNRINIMLLCSIAAMHNLKSEEASVKLERRLYSWITTFRIGKGLPGLSAYLVSSFCLSEPESPIIWLQVSIFLRVISAHTDIGF